MDRSRIGLDPPPRLGLLASRRIALLSLSGPDLRDRYLACLATFAALRQALEDDDVLTLRDLVRGSVHLERMD